MSWIQDIETYAGDLKHAVLLVEGDNDVPIYRHFFEQHSPGSGRIFYIAAAGNKLHVRTAIVQHRPQWLGIVDHDEWNPEDVAHMEAASPRLRVLPRFCIESYFCHPDELWPAIPEVRRVQVPGKSSLEQPIYGALPDWVRHGALWRVLHRLYHDTHFPDELERGPVATDNEILQVLTNWHQNLAPSRVMADYHAELQSAQQRSSDDQIRTYVHGKKFFRQVVVSQALNHLFPPLGADEWLEAFRNAGIQPPPDLQQILDWVLSLLPPRP